MPSSLLQAPTHAIKKYKRLAGNTHVLVTTPQSHLRPFGFLPSSPVPFFVLCLARSGVTPDMSSAATVEDDEDDDNEGVDGNRLLVTHI